MNAPTRVPWSVAGPARTLIQAAPAAAVVEFVDAFVHDMSDRQYAALVVLLTMLLGAVQGAVENWKGKAILRQIPPLEVPIVDDLPEGH